MHAKIMPVRARSFGTKVPQDDVNVGGHTRRVLREKPRSGARLKPGAQAPGSRWEMERALKGRKNERYPFTPDAIFCAFTRINA